MWYANWMKFSGAFGAYGVVVFLGEDFAEFEMK